MYGNPYFNNLCASCGSVSSSAVSSTISKAK